jgi:APA family basic amino acid/polyamine antiporter
VTAASTSTGAKSISLLTATCIVVANMVGTGIFTSLGFQLGDLTTGFTIMALWSVGGICALCGALCYAELGAALPRSGGEYHFLSQAYHPALGFLAGWISVTVGFAAPIAAASMAFAKYFAHLVPGLHPAALSLGIVTLVTLVHLGGVRIGSVFQNFATAFKVLLILLFIGAGIWMKAPQPVVFAPTREGASLLTSAPFAISLVYVMYSYSGWNASTYISGEVSRPSRNLPLSLALGTLIVAALYLSLNAVFLRSAPTSALAGQLEVGQVAASHILGAKGGNLMAGLISFGLLSTISAMTWIGPRVSVAIGEDLRALRFLSRRTAGGVPAVATLVQFAIVAALILTASFDRVVNYTQFSLSVCSFLAVLGVIVLRWRQPELPRPYRTWGYPVTPLIFLAISLWILFFQLRDKPVESLAGLATMALGLIVYFFSPKTHLAPAPLPT